MCEHHEKNNIAPIVVSAVMLAVGLLAFGTGMEWTEIIPPLLWYVVAFLPVGWGVAREAAGHALRGDVFNEYMLMTLASLGAFAIGEYPEAVAVMLLYQTGEMLQERAVERVRRNISSMVALRPDRASVVRDGTIVECNTAYGDAAGGVRDNTESHLKLLEEHGWTEYFDTDIMDAEGPDVIWPIEGGKILRENHVGKNILNYSSMLVLAHFKGHPMGGYGGALKQLSIGCASRAGKALIHSAGKTDDRFETWKEHASKIEFPEAMADAAKSVVDHFSGRIAFINVMKNLSVDCDCDGNAAPPCMRDIGILASLDPVAIDQAFIDLVNLAPDNAPMLERIHSRNGTLILDRAKELGIGKKRYQWVDLDR